MQARVGSLNIAETLDHALLSSANARPVSCARTFVASLIHAKTLYDDVVCHSFDRLSGFEA